MTLLNLPADCPSKPLPYVDHQPARAMTRTLAPIQIALAALLSLAALFVHAAAPEKVTTIEGVTEYRLANGLRVLLVPDRSVDTVMVHVTYLVGSRHEGYGEKGMAHLLEHMLFRGTPRHPKIKDEFSRRGARYNGTTSNDRTNYFETLSASSDNLDWALGVEADRMLNASVSKDDLDSEMTVVRNEFESGENNPGAILRQRMTQLAFSWHNYGRSVIGARSDIENVPIERLRRFYRTYYQPDNAVLAVGGNFDPAAALGLIEKHFGPLPKPSRELPLLYTVEPTQDGERSVVLRRSGDTQMVAALYRSPSAGHADYPAVDVLVHVLATSPSGRLHRALVQKGLATSVWGGENALHDPGYMYFGARLLKTEAIEPARDALVKTIEDLAREPVSTEEVERAKTALLNNFENYQNDYASLVSILSEFSAMGDWRLLFLYRDRLRKVGVDDVRRVAGAYLKPAGRVLGTFIPTPNPERAEIPPPPDLSSALAGYTGGATAKQGEAFDPSPVNIESRLIRKTLVNGIRVALLPKKTRGGKVVASLALHWGNVTSTMNRSVACGLAGAMLLRGSGNHTRAQLQDAFQKLKADVSASTSGARIETRRPQLADTLRLVSEVLRSPSFPPDEFAELKKSSIAQIESQRSDPGAIASESLALYLDPYPKGHWLQVLSMEDRIAGVRNASLEDVRKCHADLVGASGADFAAVGDFDPEQVMKLVEELFGDWKNPSPYARIPGLFFERPATQKEERTPDKANAVLRGGINLPLRDDDPDFPALVLGNYLLGGTMAGRLPARIREKEGLSYSTYSTFSASPLDRSGKFGVSAIFAPQNKDKVEAAIREEINRVLRDGYTASEVAAAKNGILEARRLARTQDRSLLGRLGFYLFIDRTFFWDVEFERRIEALTPGEIREAMRRHIDAAKLSIRMAGDFKE